jgi:hypothetical protein
VTTDDVITSSAPTDAEDRNSDFRQRLANASLLREPLLHFLVIGALIFGADALLHPPAKDERVILVPKAMVKSIVETFDEDKERAPSEAEVQQRVDSWVLNEILYREGKSLGVDKGDDMIRERITYKLRVLITDQIQVPQPTEAQLRAWLLQNHQRFDEPARVGFYYTSPSDEATARRYLEDIESQRESDDVQKKTFAIVARPVASLAASFGEGFRDALLAAPIGKWSVIQSKDGWHVVRLDSKSDGAAANFEKLREEIMRNWRADETRKQAAEAVNRLKASYTVRYEQ